MTYCLNLLGALSIGLMPVTAQTPPPEAATLTGATSMKSLAKIRTPELLKHLGKKVIIEGYFYDGSIPMLVDDFEKIRVNSLLTQDSYIPLVGRKLKLKWGDHVKVTGILEPGRPPLSHESAVLRLKASSKVQLIAPSPVK